MPPHLVIQQHIAHSTWSTRWIMEFMSYFTLILFVRLAEAQMGRYGRNTFIIKAICFWGGK